MQIVVTRRLPRPGMEKLKEAGDVWVWPHDEDMPRPELMTQSPLAEVLVPMLSDKVDEEVMAARPNLKLVANYAVGFNNIDIEAAARRGIAVTNTPGVLTEATADLTMTLLLVTARRVVEGDKLVRRGDFKGPSPEFHLGWDLQDKVLGVYGLGRIGAAVAKRARAFGLTVIYHNRKPNPELAGPLEARYVSFDELLSLSDYLSINAPLNPESIHRFTLKEFSAMKRSAILVNTGRGQTIKEDDLATALERGLIAAAALDVYEFEPKIEPRLLKMENVVLSPHVGSATREVRTKMAMIVAENVLAFAQGRPLPTRVV